MKVRINQKQVDLAREYSKKIAADTQDFIDKHTTVTVERAVCRLLGIDGVNESLVPYPNVIIDHLVEHGLIGDGISYHLGNAIYETGLSPQEIASKIDLGVISLDKLKRNDEFIARNEIKQYVDNSLDKIKNNTKKRDDYFTDYGKKSGPLLYLIVATGNIFEDISQAKAAALQGADVIAIIRTTGQSLLDYVPYGSTTEGFGGTYATQENFKLMRAALDEVGESQKRYIMLVNYASGLCMPEIAAMGAVERLDMMLNDSLYGILFRDINMQRTFVDQNFSRLINAYAKIIINTGEDNYLTTADAFEEAHTVLASQFINEQFALKAHLKEELQGLGHAYEIDPKLENSFVYELAQAQMARQIFPKAPLKYMPPTKYMTGNIFKGHVQDALFNMTTIMTNQKIHLLGMLSEAVHTPFINERSLSIENAQYIFTAMKDFSDQIEIKEDSLMQKRVDSVIDDAVLMLRNIKDEGIFKTIETGKFAGVKRAFDGGKGLDGVFEKSDGYYNVIAEEMIKELEG
ncbi:MAG: lysine 5,6-aminomutase subunit alpha [Bacilli bacterium]